MSSLNENKYRLNQDNKVYLLTVSVEGPSFKISCKDTKNPNSQNYIKYYSLDNLHSFEILQSVPSLEEALITLDKLISNEKIGVSEKNNQLKVSIYPSKGGSIIFFLEPVDASTKQQNNNSEYLHQQYSEEQFSPDIFQQGAVQTKTIVQPTQFLKTKINKPIIKTSSYDASFNQYSQTNFTNINDNNNIFNDVNSLQPSYEQSYFDNTYGIQNSYENFGQSNIIYGQTDNNIINYTQPKITTNVINYVPEHSYDVNQYLYGQTEQSFDINQYLQQPQTSIINDNIYNYQQPIIENKQISQSLKPELNIPYKQSEFYEINQSKQFITNPQQQITNQQTQQVSSSLLPQRPSLLEEKLLKDNESLKSDLEKSREQKNQLQLQIKNLKEEKEKLLLSQTTPNTNKVIADLKTENESLKSQLSEISSLKRKVAEIETLKSQLVELNTLRQKVNEMNNMKNQISELEKLRDQAAENNVLRAQLAELGVLRAQAAEAENLKKKVNELEDIRLQYEQELAKKKNINNSEQFFDTTVGDENKEIEYEKNVEQIAVKGDIIHNTAEIEMLTKKINKHNQKLTLNLLYKATVDSDKAAAFHEKCDDAQSSLVLVETTNGKRFGGFTTCSWRGDCIDKKDEDAFVFSLDKMMTYDNIPGEDAVGCYPKFGPIFLGCQIRIYDDAFTKGGTTFEKGLNFNTEEDFELNGGERVYGVKEIEVYEVIPQ